MQAPVGVLAPTMLAGIPQHPNEGCGGHVKRPNLDSKPRNGGRSRCKEHQLVDARQPGFGTALLAVVAGGALSSWIASFIVEANPTANIEALAILTSLCGAVAIKAVLKLLKFEIAFPFAAGALLAGRVASLAVVQLMPDLGGHAIPGFPAYGLFSTFPSLVLSAWLVQICAARRRTVTY